MSPVTIVVLLAVLFTWFTWMVLRLPISARLRWGMVLAVLLFLGLLYVTLAETLGKPKPAKLEIVAAEEVTLLSHHFIQDEAIFVWVKPRDSDTPIAYKFPWTDMKAKEIHDGAEKNKKTGKPTQVVLQFNTFSKSDIELIDPIPAIPPQKTVETTGPIVIE